jgi:hypothetical protein
MSRCPVPRSAPARTSAPRAPASVSTTLESRVSVETHNATVADVGELLGKVSAVELLVPAASIRDRVILDVKETTLAEVVDELGLVVGSGQASSD